MKPETDIEQRILEAAEKIFMSKGFAATKTTDIAAKAGCNHALIHYYFRTKENLFEKVFVNMFSVGVGQLTVEIDSVKDIVELTGKLVSSHLSLVEKRSRLPLFILNELTTNPARIDMLRNIINNYPLFNEFFFKLEAVLQREAEEGHIRPIGAMNYMLNIVSLTIMTVTILPIFAKAANVDRKGQKSFLEMRREEITQLVLRGIQL